VKYAQYSHCCRSCYCVRNSVVAEEQYPHVIPTWKGILKTKLWVFGQLLHGFENAFDGSVGSGWTILRDVRSDHSKPIHCFVGPFYCCFFHD